MPAYIASAPKRFPPLDISQEAPVVTRKQIDIKHPEFLLNQEKWFNVSVLYTGGDEIKRVADRFLKRRPKEDQTVYQHRVDQFCYEDNLGCGLGWHEAEMFENDPAIEIKVKGKDGQPTDAEISPDQQAFYPQKFLKDCDCHGTTFIDMYRRVFTQLLLFGQTYVSVDLPARDPDNLVQTLQDERAKGLLDPYICAISPMDVINWDKDDHGNLLWAVIYSKNEQQRFLKKPVVVERWYWYDRQQYRVYEAKYEKPQSAVVITGAGMNSAPSTTSNLDAEKVPIELVRAGYHALAGKNVVPLQHIQVPDGWYMGNRAYLPALEHLNLSNALKFSLYMAALAVPVLITDDDVSSITMSETGFIKLGIGSSYHYAEPTGTCWEKLSERCKTLTEEIWRALYLVSQARSTTATASSQSGISKKQDMAPSHDVLNGLGDILRAKMQVTLEWVAAARVLAGFEADSNLTFDVRGFAFEEKLSTDEIAVIQDLLNMEIPSDLLEKELFILAARAALRDANADTLKAIIDQIRAAPDKATRVLEQQNAQAEQLQKTMVKTMGLDDPEGEGDAPAS
jgi:hypothetical protein